MHCSWSQLTCIVLAVSLLAACKMAANRNESEETKRAAMEVFSEEAVQALSTDCDYIDYIFYDLPFSMSQDSRAAILSNIQFITNQPLDRPHAECGKALGRVIYQVKGNIVAEADIYLNESCNCYLFMEDDHPKFANQMSPQGAAFYNQIIKQVSPQTVQ